MPTIKEIREKIDAGLDFIQTKAEAAQVQMKLGSMELEDRFSAKFKELNAAVTELQDRLTELGIDEDEISQQLQETIDRLKIKIALGKMETRDAVGELQKEIEKRIDDFDAVINSIYTDENEEKVKSALKNYIDKVTSIKAEVEARIETFIKNKK
jgi:hypothetical protein